MVALETLKRRGMGLREIAKRAGVNRNDLRAAIRRGSLPSGMAEAVAGVSTHGARDTRAYAGGGGLNELGEAVCPMCGTRYSRLSTNHRYCRPACRNKAFRRGLHRQHAQEAFEPHSFACRECGHTVEVTDPGDHRTVFCCGAHERAWWRRASKRPTALTVRYAWELEHSERRDAS